MDFSLYKNRLLEYLRIKGVDIDVGGNFSCINPRHGDSTPSCNVYEEKGAIKFHCFGCGCGGDIYDAVELLDGIGDRAGQFKFLESVFGGNYTPPPMKKIYIAKKQKYQHIAAKYDELENYMRGNPMREEMAREFLATRARVASHGELSSYPDDIADNLVKFFLYFPGNDIAQGETPAGLLDACHVPQRASSKSEYSDYTWRHSGVVLRLGAGFKLHFYKENECVKPGTLGCSTFPMPGTLPPDAQRVVLVEGELDAVACRAAGVPDVYAIGGTNGLTAPKVQQYLLGVKEIVLMLDNDDAGLKTMGLIPLDEKDRRKTPLPDIIRKAGFEGSIKTARLHTYKDPDDCILHGRKEIVIDAIKNATEYKPLESEPKKKEVQKAADADNSEKGKFGSGRLEAKVAKNILKRLPKSALDKPDVAPFVSAMIRAVLDEQKQEVAESLRGWGAAEAVLKKPGNYPGSHLLILAKKYNLSYYYTNKIELATIDKSDFDKIAKGFKTPVNDSEFEKIIKTNDFSTFIYSKCGEKSTANIIAKILENKIIYVESEKHFYFYNGHIWEHTADITGIVYNVLSAAINYAKKKKAKEYALDDEENKKFNMARAKIEGYSFINNVVRLVRVMPSIYRKEIVFDGTQIQETLTLQDGVIDFSGEKVVFRNSKPEEYRRKMLPYTIDQVCEGKKPDRFLAFLDSYFKDKETLKTLVYFLSTIPSRRAQFKHGGIFIGASDTGKTTLMKFFGELFAGMVTVLPPSLIMNDGRKFRNDDAPSPYMARLEGAGCAIRDETPRNAQLRCEAWKELTGGGMLTARGMYAMPRDFMPTAQIVIMSNYPPRFDGNDAATINRMIAINFRIQHKKGDAGTRTESELRDELMPEYPLMVKYFAEKYIELKRDYNSVVPLSKECKMFRESYVEDQKTDLGKFFDTYVNVDIAGDTDCKIQTHELFRYFCKYAGIELDENDKPTGGSKWTLTSFTKAILSDYVGVHTKQIKVDGYPVQFYTGLKLKDDVDLKGLERAQQDLPATQSAVPSAPTGDSDDSDMPDEMPF